MGIKGKIFKLGKSVRSAGNFSGRASSIWVSAVRYGWIPVAYYGVKTVAKEGPRDLHWKALGDGIVRVFQNMGPVFIKLGQILATREDLLPRPVCERLEKLYGKQSPMNSREIKRLLYRNFGKETPFSEFTRKALAVGSVGQVHRANLQSGDAVVSEVCPIGGSIFDPA